MFYNTSSVVITTSSRHYYKTKLSKTVVQTITVSSEFEKQRKIEHDGYNTAQRYTKLAQAWYHSSGSLPAEDGSHSTDQPEGKEQGQVRLAVWSSKLIPEKGFNSKAEYTNTQQDLIVNGYT